MSDTSNDDVYNAIVDSLLLTSEESDVDLNPLDNTTAFQYIAFSGENFTNFYDQKYGNDEFKLAGFTGTISAVPLPGALPLLALGLGGFGLIRWRRRHRA